MYVKENIGRLITEIAVVVLRVKQGVWVKEKATFWSPNPHSSTAHILQADGDRDMKVLSDQIPKQQMLLNAEKNVGSIIILNGQSIKITERY